MGEIGRVSIESMALDTIRCLRLIVNIPMREALDAGTMMDAYKQARESGKDMELLVRSKPRKRTLDQNAYMWLLLERLAVALRSTAEEVYEQMLDRYGLHVYIKAPPGSEETIRRTVRQAKTVQTMERGGGAVVYKAIIGSSHYDTVQMARLLDGIIDECKLLGIKTEPDEGWTLKGWTL